MLCELHQQHTQNLYIKGTTNVHSRKHKTEYTNEDTAYHSDTCKQTKWLLISCKYANINVLINYKCTHGIYIYMYSTHMYVCMRYDF